MTPAAFSHLLDRFAACTPRLDGALILDYGRIAHTAGGMFRSVFTPWESGLGAGFGIRITEPRLKISACSDFVWDVPLNTKPVELYQMTWHLYSGINF